MCVSSIALSHFLEDRYPAPALVFFPFNTEARVRLIETELAGTRDLAGIERQSRRALRYDLGDARLWSLLGEVKVRQGDADAALRLFDHARGLSKTEVHALKRAILRSVEAGDLTGAVAEIDVLLRRWPAMLAVIAPLFPAILADPAGYGAVVSAMAADVPWRRGLLRQLALEPAWIDLADRLLLDLRGSPHPPRPTELAAVIGKYIAAGRYDAAHRLFLFSLTDDERKLAGYVHNGGFEAASLGRPFDWQLQPQSGVQVTFAGEDDRATGTAGATLRFLNRPFKGAPMRQYLLLPPGTYVLTMDASAGSLKLPKDLFWAVDWLPSKTGIGKLSVPEGTFETRRLEAVFTVPPEGCAGQMLQLEAAVLVQSWRYSYGGVLTIHRLRIERLAA